MLQNGEGTIDYDKLEEIASDNPKTSFSAIQKFRFAKRH